MKFDDVILLKNELNALKRMPKNKPSLLPIDVVKELMANGFISPQAIGLAENNRPIYSDNFQMTDTGKRYLHSIRKANYELWQKSVWIPIIVSFTTAALANYILPKLPMILKWFANTLLGMLS